MKISERTLSVINNFGTINRSLYIPEGSIIRTMDSMKTIFAVANVEENFPEEFIIPDVAKFLNVLSLFKEPEIEFCGNHMLITSENQRVKLTYGEPSIMKLPPSKDLPPFNVDIEFDLKKEKFKALLKAKYVLNLPTITLIGEDGMLSFKTMDIKNPTSDSFKIDLGETDLDFKVVFSPDNLKLMDGDYHVKINLEKLRSKFDTENLTYYIAPESRSES